MFSINYTLSTLHVPYASFDWLFKLRISFAFHFLAKQNHISLSFEPETFFFSISEIAVQNSYQNAIKAG